MEYKVDINISVRDTYHSSFTDNISKTIKVKSFEELNLLMGRLLQHLPKENK